jgi:hypothetical protein
LHPPATLPPCAAFVAAVGLKWSSVRGQYLSRNSLIGFVVVVVDVVIDKERPGAVLLN